MKHIVLIILTSFPLIAVIAQNDTVTDTTRINTKANFNFSEFSGIQVKSIEEAFKTRDFLVEKYKDDNPVIVSDYFLLGTLNAYFARFDSSTVNKSSLDLSRNQFDLYWKSEQQKATYLVNYCKDSLDVPVSMKKQGNGSLILYSAALAKRINAYFNESRTLKPELFNNDEEFYSYLLGCYFRTGSKEGNHTYRISQFYLNSDKMFQLLRKAGCNQIAYIHHNKIPGRIDFTFEASVLIEKYFEIIDIENNEYLLNQ